MSQSRSSDPSAIDVRHFARVFVDHAGLVPPQAEAFKSDRGVYYRLNITDIDPEAATALVEKAADTFEVELVGQVREDGRVVKERRYVETVADVPEGYQPQRGPKGGIYYETNPLNDPRDRPNVGDATETTGYSGQPVLAVQFEDVEEGDRVAFENPDTGERDMGEVVDIDSEDNLVAVESGDGITPVQAAAIGAEAEKDDGMTSDTQGAHNAVYGGQDYGDACLQCGERDRVEGSMMCAQCDPQIEKDDPGPWVFYMGPEGGEGWQSMSTGDVRYQAQRPGPAPEDPMVEGDFASGWAEPPDEMDSLVVGQRIEFQDTKNEGDYYEAIVSNVDEYNQGEGFVEVDVPEEDVQGFVISEENDNSQITAVEEDPDPAVDQLDHDIGEEVHIRTDHLTQENPDYKDFEGVIDGVETHNGDLLYNIAEEEGGPVVIQPTEDGLEDLLVEDDDGDDGGWEDQLEDLTNEEVFNPDEGDPIEIEWPEAHTEGPFEAVFEPYDDPNAESPEPGYRITEGAYDGTWVSHEEADIVDTLEGSGDGPTDDYDAGNMNPTAADWQPLDHVDDSVLENGDSVAQVIDYDHDDHKTMFIGVAYHDSAQDEWKIDVMNHDEKDFNLETAVNDNDAEAYITAQDAPADVADDVADLTGDEVIDHLEGGPDDGVYFEIPENYAGEGDIGEATAYVGGDIVYEGPDGEDHWIVEDKVAENAVSVGEPPDASEGTDAPEAGAGGTPVDDDEPAAEAVGEPVEGDVDVAEGPAGWQQDWTADVVTEDGIAEVDEWGTLGDFHFPGGVSQQFMRVGATAEYNGEDNDGLVFGNFYGGSDEHGIDDADLVAPEKANLGRRQMATYLVADAVDANVPTCHSPDGGDTVYTEGVEGENIGVAPQEYIEQVDPDEFYEEAAVQIICGNNDAHDQNVLVTPDGTPVFHDIDHSAGDMGGSFVGKKTQYKNAIDRTLNELWRSAKHVVDEDKQTAKEKMLAAAEEKAQEIQGSEAVNDALSEVQEYDDEYSSNIAGNIMQLADGDIDMP